MMRIAAVVVCLAGTAALWQAGCSGKSKRPEPSFAQVGPKGAAVRPSTNQLAVVSGRILIGKVVRFHAPGRFAVVNFPVGRLPQVGQLFHVYRAGIKVGEVKITGPQLDDNIVADVSAGGAQPGDEVRDR